MRTISTKCPHCKKQVAAIQSSQIHRPRVNYIIQAHTAQKGLCQGSGSLVDKYIG